MKSDMRPSPLCLQQAIETYNGYNDIFQMQREEFVHLDAVEKEIEGRYAVWKALYDLQQKVIDWTTGPVLNMSDNTVSGHNSIMLVAGQPGWAQPEDAEACKGRHSQTADTAVNQVVQVSIAEALIQLAPGSRGHCCRMGSSSTDAAKACSALCGTVTCLLHRCACPSKPSEQRLRTSTPRHTRCQKPTRMTELSPCSRTSWRSLSRSVGVCWGAAFAWAVGSAAACAVLMLLPQATWVAVLLCCLSGPGRSLYDLELPVFSRHMACLLACVAATVGCWLLLSAACTTSSSAEELSSGCLQHFPQTNQHHKWPCLQVLPVMEQLCNPALKERHWRAIFALLGLDVVRRQQSV